MGTASAAGIAGTLTLRELPEGVSVALGREVHPSLPCTACGNEQVYWIRLLGVKVVDSASKFFICIFPTFHVLMQCQYIYSKKISIHYVSSPTSQITF